ncbi:hypothetical protein GWI33_008441 [Rhynchophorus ferrugineus]|uniref:RNA-directed DNA polymerase n=1 Tax=Rhynchophorus ferrugineus TaxID=354439 RepID=A0A834IGQ0_RHYFE|nr:hypothetical protein GWI33_008441 [Rhynchophorus ferrugineus]
MDDSGSRSQPITASPSTGRQIRCYICNKTGHMARMCRGIPHSLDNGSQSEPKNHPDGPNRTTLHSPQSVAQAGSAQLAIEKVTVEKDVVQIQGTAFRGYLDTGSQINVANMRVAKSLNLQLETPDTYIKGFGNQITYAKRQACLVIQTNGVSVDSTLHFVKTEMGNWRRSDLTQSDVKIDLKKCNKVETENDEQQKSTRSPPHWSQILAADPIFHMNITNMSNTTLKIGGKQTVARGYEIKERQIDEFRNYELQTIDANEIYMGEIPRKGTNKLGVTDIIEFQINLTSKEPVFYKPYRISEREKEIIREKVNELLDNDIVRESKSSYASPEILVKKKNNDYRLAIDYRKLNRITVKDRYPLPNIEDHIARLKRYKYFCVLDMTQGYYQIPVAESSVDKTALITPDGCWEFLRMPFGVCNAPATFQRLLNAVLGKLRFREVMIYLDDILIPSTTINEDTPFKWGGKQRQAFDEMIKTLTERALLSIFDIKLLTELHTDASSKGIAAILLQKHGNNLKPVMYYSRATTKEESVYHSYELETLGGVEIPPS